MSQNGQTNNGHGVMYQDHHHMNKNVGLAAATAPVPMPTPLAPPPLRTHPYQAGSGFQESVAPARPDAAQDGLDGWTRGPEIEMLSRFVDNGYHYEGDLTMPASSAPVPSPGDLQNPAAEGSWGMVIQSYTTLEELGFGGAGKAFLVKGKVDGKHYVSKQINCLGKEYKAAPASYALHETRLLFMLRHPHIVQLKDFYPKSSNYFIVMEFCENGDLGNLIEKAIRGGGVRFDTERIFTWWYQILDGVDYCHSKGIIHRDLKPKNIFIDSGHNVKIGDFGVSALTSFPQATERVGTVRYHAPEVISSLLYTFKSDVWSIGCIMWEVIALRPPSKEPINLQNIDLSLIPKMYGSATRDLLLLHLQHLDHRPSVSAIKKAMLSNLASAGRQLVQSVADASASMQHASEREANALMAPRHVTAPFKISDAASRDANGQASAVVGPGLSGDKVKVISTSSHGGGHGPSSLVGQKSISDSSDASGGLGIHLAAGEGGEYGAWKIVLLPPDKPAALSGNVSIGEYLWEVNGKVTFGMPYGLIVSMFSARTGPTKIGLKRGLGLPIRHVILSCENVQHQGEAKPAVEHDDIHDVSRTGQDTEESLGSAVHEIKKSHPQEPKTDALAWTPPSACPPLQMFEANTAGKHEMSESQSVVQVSSRNREADTSGNTVESGGSISRKMDSIDAEPNDMNLSPNLGIASVPHHEPVQGPGTNGKTGSDGAGSSGECTIAGNGHYAGELVDGRPEGKGKATWPKQGHTYIGEWRNGVMHGQGSAIYLNGDRYDGEWSMGKRCGLGRYTHGSGDVYEGLWSNERKHGLGVDSFVDGRGYYGEFSDNKFAGIGTYYTGDGAIYQGQWRTGKAHGIGFSTSSQGGVTSFVQYSHGNLVESEIFETSLHQERQLTVQRQSRAALAVALFARRVASSILGVEIDGPQVVGSIEPEPALDHVIAFPDALIKAIYILAGVKTDKNMVIQDVVDKTSSSQSSSSKAYAAGDSILEICRRSCSWFAGMPLQDILSWLQTHVSSEGQAPTLEIGIKTQSAQQWFITSRIRLAVRDQGFIV